MKYPFLSLLIMLVVLLQSSFLPPFGIKLNLLLVIVLFLLFLGLVSEAYYSAFFGGLLLDLLTSGIFGISSLFLLLIGGAVRMVKKLLGEGFWTLVPLSFVAALTFRRGDWRGALADTLALGLLFPLLRWSLSKMFADRELKVR